MTITYKDVTDALKSGTLRRFETPDEVKAIVSSADRGDCLIVPRRPEHRCLLVSQGIESGIDAGRSPKSYLVEPYKTNTVDGRSDDGLPCDCER